MMIRLLKFIWYKVSAMGRFFRSISRAPGSDPTWRCRGTISAASPRNKQRFSTWKNGEMTWHHQEAAEKHGKTPPNDMPWFPLDFQVISPVSLVNSQFPCLHWSILIPSAVEMAGLFKHHATEDIVHTIVSLASSASAGAQKANGTAFHVFFHGHLRAHQMWLGILWTSAHHLHTSCNKEWVLFSICQRHVRNWAKHPWKTMPSRAKSCQIPPKNWLPISGTKCLSSKAIQFASPCSALACATTSALMMFSNGVQKDKGR